MEYLPQFPYHPGDPGGHESGKTRRTSRRRNRSRVRQHSARVSGPGLLGAIAWTAGIFSGLFSLVAESAVPSLQKLRRRFVRWRLDPIRDNALDDRGFDPSRGQFINWRRRVMGRSRQQVADSLGNPPAAALGTSPAGPHLSTINGPTLWNANTWYYPYDPTRHSAVAIEFREDRVSRIDFIGRLR